MGCRARATVVCQKEELFTHWISLYSSYYHRGWGVWGLTDSVGFDEFGVGFEVQGSGATLGVRFLSQCHYPLGGARGFRFPYISGCCVTKFAPHKALKFIARCKLTLMKGSYSTMWEAYQVPTPRLFS